MPKSVHRTAFQGFPGAGPWHDICSVKPVRGCRGFTQIELLVVLTVCALVAALALPGLLSSQRASNERGASAALKTLASAQADFRENDRDGNKVQDFWTRDVAGLYGVVPAGETETIKLIDRSVAGADF